VQELIKKHADKVRFAIVGGLSTIIDFGILFALVGLGFPSIPSNFVSTFVASIFNFFAHKTFTFKDNTATSAKHIVSYTIVTLGGLWLAQPIVLYLNDVIFRNWGPATGLVGWIVGLTGGIITKTQLILFIGKCFATGATIIWNYFLYRKYVYKKSVE